MRARSPLHTFFAFAFAFGGCLGAVGTKSGSKGDGGVGKGDGGATQGDGGSTAPTAVPDDLPLPRLSLIEYQQTLTDLITEIDPNDATAVMAVLTPIAAGMPADELVAAPNQKHGGFSRLDQSVQQAYANIAFEVALAAGAQLTNSDARIASLLGSCYTASSNTITSSCLNTFISSFGALVLRRPPSADDLTFYATAAPANASAVTALTQVIAVLLQSPRFLYHVESGADAVAASGANVYALDPWELASRLSYQFWGTMPDKTLRADAASGALLTDSGYQAEVTRLFADPRTDATLRVFWTQWLWPIEELPALDSENGDATFNAFAGTPLPTDALKGHMVNEVLDAASWTLSSGGTFRTLLTDNHSFARDADLAAIYGVGAWDGTSAPPAFPSTRTGGLLTRAAFLSTGSAETRPIMKGVFIRTTLLCDIIGTPPAAAAAAVVGLSPTETTRQEVETLTQGTGTVCAGCHSMLINPLGFATEDFDALGRYRTTQPLYDSMGNQIADPPVDPTSIPEVKIGDMTPSTGPADLLAQVVKSGLVEPCFATRYFRFTFRRLEDPTLDASILAFVANEASSGMSLGDILTSVVNRVEFKQRLIQP